MTCFIAQNLLSEYIDGDVMPDRLRELETHLAGCQACQTELAQFRGVRQMLRSLPVERAPVGFVERVNERAGARSPVRRASSWATGLWRRPSVLAGATIGILVVAAVGVYSQGGLVRFSDFMSSHPAGMQPPSEEVRGAMNGRSDADAGLLDEGIEGEGQDPSPAAGLVSQSEKPRPVAAPGEAVGKSAERSAKSKRGPKPMATPAPAPVRLAARRSERKAPTVEAGVPQRAREKKQAKPDTKRDKRADAKMGLDAARNQANAGAAPAFNTADDLADAAPEPASVESRADKRPLRQPVSRTGAESDRVSKVEVSKDVSGDSEDLAAATGESFTIAATASPPADEEKPEIVGLFYRVRSSVLDGPAKVSAAAKAVGGKEILWPSGPPQLSEDGKFVVLQIELPADKLAEFRSQVAEIGKELLRGKPDGDTVILRVSINYEE